MLRDIRHSFLQPRLVALKYITASNAVTQKIGVGSTSSLTSAATGSGVIKFYRTFSRPPVCIANGGIPDIAAPGWVGGTANTFPTALGHTLITNGSVADDGTCHAIFLGWDQRDTTRYSRRSNAVRSDFDGAVVRAFQVNTASSGSIAINARNASIKTRTGTGDVTLTLRSAYASAPVVIATAKDAACRTVLVDSIDAQTIRIQVFDNSGTAQDAIVNVIVVGDAQGTGERASNTPAMSDQRKPIMFGYSLKYASGSPTIDIGSGDMTISGTSEVTFTPTLAYARESIICAMQISNAASRWCTVTSSAAGSFKVKCWSSAGGAAAPTDTAGFQVIGIGFDDASEY